jgi:hypothetical protein
MTAPVCGFVKPSGVSFSPEYLQKELPLLRGGAGSRFSVGGGPFISPANAAEDETNASAAIVQNALFIAVLLY